MKALLQGDTRFFWPENIHFFSGFPQAWDASLNTGIGQPSIGTLWITSYLNVTTLLSEIGVPWIGIEFFFWLLPALILSFVTVTALFSYLFPKQKTYKFIAGLIYLFNTYFILNFLGGQMGVSLAYSIAPFVLLRFFKLFTKPTRYKAVLAGMALAIQLLFDPRFVYLNSVIIAVYWVVFGVWKKRLLQNIALFTFIPAGIVVLLHSFWIIPLFLFRAPTLPASFDSVKGFEFFSFADFSHSFALLHPNWPENLFGKAYFLEPYFLILPLLAFVSLIFIKKSKTNDQHNRLILFFSFLALLGVFMAKGAKEPFGSINILLFEYVPGMQLFRDPTKFYYFISLSYAMLIPVSLMFIFESYKKKLRIKKTYLLVIFVAFWIGMHAFSFFRYPVKPVIYNVPKEYVALKSFLGSERTFFRTVWIPQWQRYGYFSPMQPAIGRGEVVGNGTPIQLAKRLESAKVIDQLRLYGVRYIILPYDSEGEIFINNRKYDEKIYQQTRQILDRNRNIELNRTFGHIRVYALKGGQDRFTLNGKTMPWQYISPSHYQLEPKNDTINGRVVFSESFNPHWVAIIDGKEIQSEKYKGLVNSFPLQGKTDRVEIYFRPQRWVIKGLLISSLTLGLIGANVFYERRKTID